MQHVSPELVLVDPELAAAARLMLPEPGDCLARCPFHKPALEVVKSGLVLGPSLQRPIEIPQSVVRRRWPSMVGAGVAWVFFVGILGSSILAFIPPSKSARPLLMESLRDVRSTPPWKGGPAEKRLAGGAAALQWSSSHSAVGYSVVLTRGAEHYDFWSPRTTLRFAERPRDPSTKRLSAGRYAWSVYPIFRAQKRIWFGPVIVSGVVTVPNDPGL